MLMKSPTIVPSLESLSYILRHQELWPKRFDWCFKYRATCAIGLSYRLWEDHKLFNDLPPSVIERIFIKANTKPRIKIGWWFSRARRHEEVTPDMVADQIDEHLAVGR